MQSGESERYVVHGSGDCNREEARIQIRMSDSRMPNPTTYAKRISFRVPFDLLGTVEMMRLFLSHSYPLLRFERVPRRFVSDCGLRKAQGRVRDDTVQFPNHQRLQQP